MDLLNWLFDSTQFMPRTHCGPGWEQDPALITWQKISAMVTFLCYILIGTALLLNRDVFKRAVPKSFGMLITVWAFFIALCGFTHLSDFVIFSDPWYRLDTVLRAATAAVSAIALFTLPLGLREARNLQNKVLAEEELHLIERVTGAMHRIKLSPDLSADVLHALHADLSQGKIKEES